MADNRKRAPRGGKQAASGSRPIRRNDRAAASKGQRDRTQAARPQRDRNRDAVQAPKGEFIEGRRAAAEALRTGFPIKCALIAEGGERDAALSRLVDDLNTVGVRIKYVPRAQLDALSSHGAHQGIALEVGNFPYADVADILDRAGEGPALVVVLDHVTDDGNFGAIVRSAEVVGAAGVIIANKRAAGVTVGS
ncbi:MAG: 23S rRNA (guanosine(2251)-2'-O)-methyltransferase RlmB, partial [Collinsella sp.]|nr:23S rRNA (guanosine(2251)-2'-O)-methyltransferase RlmB [Collinsella sp.]